MTRRLAAILAADVVGYSKLMGKDEAGTLAALRHLRQEVFTPAVTKHRGSLVKSMGDGWLVEFASVGDGVSCAIRVQEALAKHDLIKLRIGLHIGDVTFEDDDIYGDGVNVAARLEKLAKPGAVVISDVARRSIDSKTATKFVELGLQRLKNIDEPMIAHGWGMTAVEHRTGAPYLPGMPSIVVLPFENRSGDPEQEYFSDGITEDIITELSRFSGLFVIARNSSFTYKGQATKTQDIMRDLGARYVLEGSVRKAGNRIRVTAQLVEAESGNQLWAERYDDVLEDIFELQDKITRAIVAVLPGRLELTEAARVKRKSPKNMAAYECLLAGKIHHHLFTKEDNSKAQNFLKRAIELDSDYASAYAWQACVLSQAFKRQYEPNPEDLFQRAIELVEKAISIDENEIECHRMLCELAMMRQQWKKARQHSERAILLNPNHPLLLAQRGELLTWLGKAEEGAEWVRKAMALDRYSAPQWAHLLGRALMLMEQYEDAINAYSETPHSRFSYHADLAGCCAALDLKSEANVHVLEVLKLNPDFSISDYVEGLTYKEQRNRHRHRELLERAGFPE